MKRFVLDASVALAWFVDVPVPDYAVKVQRALMTGAKAVVPALWHLEMANGFAMAERRRILAPRDVTASLVQVERLSSHIETDQRLFSIRRALDPARACQLSAYDATYFEIARIEGLPLATLDRQLRNAASLAGITLFH